MLDSCWVSVVSLQICFDQLHQHFGHIHNLAVRGVVCFCILSQYLDIMHEGFERSVVVSADTHVDLHQVHVHSDAVHVVWILGCLHLEQEWTSELSWTLHELLEV